MNSIENIPQVWDDERDGRFFRITTSVFSPSFCYGAGALLASYDPEDDFAPAPETTTFAAQPADAPTTAPASSTPVDHTTR
jgi:hypothetical protein